MVPMLALVPCFDRWVRDTQVQLFSYRERVWPRAIGFLRQVCWVGSILTPGRTRGRGANQPALTREVARALPDLEGRGCDHVETVVDQEVCVVRQFGKIAVDYLVFAYHFSLSADGFGTRSTGHTAPLSGVQQVINIGMTGRGLLSPLFLTLDAVLFGLALTTGLRLPVPGRSVTCPRRCASRWRSRGTGAPTRRRRQWSDNAVRRIIGFPVFQSLEEPRLHKVRPLISES